MLQLLTQTSPTKPVLPVLNRSSRPGERSWITLATVNDKDWFTRPSLARVTAHSLHHSLADTNARILAWVLLPDQLQLLIQAGSNCSVANATQRVKACTAIAVNQAASASVGMVGPLWKTSYHLQPVCQPEQARELALRMLKQPQQLGLVNHYSNYPYWNSIWV